jgi:hypothetical protein
MKPPKALQEFDALALNDSASRSKAPVAYTLCSRVTSYDGSEVGLLKCECHISVIR